MADGLLNFERRFKDGSNYASGTYFIKLELDINGHKLNNIQKAVLIK